MITASASWWIIFSIATEGVLQISLSIDLVLTLKKPFTPKEPRVKYYIIKAILFGILQASFSHLFKFDRSDNDK